LQGPPFNPIYDAAGAGKGNATEDVIVLLPGGVLVEGAEIGSIMSAPDDVKIGFDLASEGQGFETIRIALRQGDVLTLHRSSQAMVLGEDARPRRFSVIERPL